MCLRQTCRPSRQIDRHNESETEKEGIHGERNDGALPEGSRHPELSNNKLTGTAGLEGSAVPGIVMQPAFQKHQAKTNTTTTVKNVLLCSLCTLLCIHLIYVIFLKGHRSVEVRSNKVFVLCYYKVLVSTIFRYLYYT